MKKILLLLLSLTMVFNTTTVAFASEQTEEQEDIYAVNNDITGDPVEDAITLNNPTEEELMECMQGDNVKKIELNIDYSGTMLFSSDVAQIIKEKNIEVSYNIAYNNAPMTDIVGCLGSFMTSANGTFMGANLTDLDGLDFDLTLDIDFESIQNYTDEKGSLVLHTMEHSVLAIPDSYWEIQFGNYTEGEPQKIVSVGMLSYDAVSEKWTGQYTVSSSLGENRSDLHWDSYSPLQSGTEYVMKIEYEPEWQYAYGIWHYYDKNGYAVTGWMKDKGKWYYLDPDNEGDMLTGWQYINHYWYYMNPSGAMVTGWKYINHKWYYLNAGGSMATGWKKLSGKWYYLNPNGSMATGWKKVSGKWYYLNPSGSMAEKRWVGRYYVNGSGVWTKTK